jgi:hypothetical protein
LRSEVFEWPIPNNPISANAILFELRIPDEISILRDSLHIFLTKVLCLKTKGPELMGLWLEHPDLKQYKLGNQRYVTLGSNCALFRNTRFKELKVYEFPDVNDYIKPCGYNLCYSSLKYEIKYGKKTHFRDLCTLRALEPFACLDWALSSTNHTENQVIAALGICPQTVSKAEFLKFGLYRSGPRLQALNLIDALESKILPFKHEAVFNLMIQALWELGPITTKDVNPVDCLIWHSEFNTEKYLNQLFVSLHELLSTTVNNWDHHLVLLNIVLIAARAASLTYLERFKENFFELLNECRKVSIEWIKLIEETKNCNHENQQMLDIKLIDICFITVLTYMTDVHSQAMLLKSDDDLTNLLIVLSKIYDHRTASHNKEENNFRRNFLRIVDYTALMLEYSIEKHILETDYSSLNHFLKIKWPDSSKGRIQEWRKSTSEHAFKGEFVYSKNFETAEITVGLNGAFLVDDKPISKLPSTILNHSLFQRVFCNSDFNVYFNSQTDSFISLTENSIQYEFSLNSMNNQLFIQEIKDTRIFSLIPHSCFYDIFPKALIEDFSHWLSADRLCIYFRSKLFSDPLFHDLPRYEFHFSTKILSECSTNRNLISITSSTFRELYESFAFRLSSSDSLLMLTEAKSINVEFLQLGISFRVNKSERTCISNDFRGLILSPNQTLGTLLGLEQGLVLMEQPSLSSYSQQFYEADGFTIEESGGGRPSTKSFYPYGTLAERSCLNLCSEKLLVPHGTLKITRPKANQHQKVEILTDVPREPPFFIFEVDARLNTLRAGQSILAWLYLAWLHGATSHVLSDHFCRISGTANALRLLQSAHCWSCRPLPDEALTTLNGIAALSPVRKFEPQHKKEMQQIKWPEGLDSIAAHDAFIFLAEKIVADSNRLNFAYPDGKHRELNVSTKGGVSVLYKRAYFRDCSERARLENEFKDIIGMRNNKAIIFGEEGKWSKETVKLTRIVASQCSCPPKNYYPKKLFKRNTLQGVNENSLFQITVNNLILAANNFYDYWLTLFECCLQENKNTEIIFALSFFAYCSVNAKELFFLQFIAMKDNKSSIPHAPAYMHYTSLDQFHYDSTKIKKILFTYFSDEKFCKQAADINNPLIPIESRENTLQPNFAEAKINAIEEAELFISRQWPCSGDIIFDNNNFDIDKVINEVGLLFQLWHSNHSLRMFADKVSSSVNSISLIDDKVNLMPILFKRPVKNEFLHFMHRVRLTFAPSTPNEVALLKQAEQIAKCGRLFDQKFIINSRNNNQEKNPSFPISNPIPNCNVGNHLAQELLSSWKEHHRRFNSERALLKPKEELVSLLVKYREEYYHVASQLKITVHYLNMYSSLIDQNLFFSLILPNLNPMLMLRLLLSNSCSSIQIDSKVRTLFTALAVIWTQEQRLERCLKWLDADTQNIELETELLNQAYENWSPKDHIEWVVLQIELDMTIRRVQALVASTMMSPPNGHNTVTQLNMGEGKTALIIPMIAAVLANGDNLLRLTVLKPLFNMNFEALVHKLGGLLNRRVYALPCTRDMPLSTGNVLVIKRVLDECVKNKGVLVTLPEQRLSFALRALDSCRDPNLKEIAKGLMGIEEWMKSKVRDVLDESDEILDPKYQIVYTIGSQTNLAGGNLRWRVAQAVLERAKKYFIVIREQYSNDVVLETINQHPAAFPMFRLLSDRGYRSLCELICRDILSDHSQHISLPRLHLDEINTVLEFILSQSVPQTVHERCRQIIIPYTEAYDIVTILRGLFTYQSFYFALNKRWRVDYGVSPEPGRPQQAVPFRAKDVPAERAQFAHPDTAILLTQLSYYYSGLSLSQLTAILRKLEKDSYTGTQEYDHWLEQLEPLDPQAAEVRFFASLNFSDEKQLQEIVFPLLRFYPPVIDYYLNTFVYPKEAREYSHRMGMSAWDLSVENNRPMTGFSGTNDSKLLLPPTTQYYDTAELLGTNGGLINSLLLEENRSYEVFPEHTSGREMLRLMAIKDKRIRLILDAGALILELTNEQVVKEWLKIRIDLKAGIFFDQNNHIMVIDRRGMKTRFELSPYRTKLEECVVFLDDAHTRGTDLKIPIGTVGAVTLGKGVTKDKLMQACMRMRKLGNGHSVCFFAAKEVDDEIRGTQKRKITSLQVIEWAVRNTREHIISGLFYWALQGLAYAKKLAIYEKFRENNDLEAYANAYIEKDVHSIYKMYRKNRLEALITEIVASSSVTIRGLLKKHNIPSTAFEKYAQIIASTCERLIPNERKFSKLLDEEQEIELEIEKDEERLIIKPLSLNPCQHSLNPIITEFITTGRIRNDPSSFLPIYEMFKDSSVYQIIQKQAWGQNVFVTQDFARTVDKVNNGDDYLKSVRWLCYSEVDKPIIVILSAFEANSYYDEFENGLVKLVLNIPRRRVEQLQMFGLQDCSIPQSLVQRVSVVSASHFFQTSEELEAYLRFVGYCPSPRTEREEGMFEEGIIERNGYVQKINRRKVFGNEECKFEEDPGKMIMKIAEIRNFGTVSRFSHHLLIFLEGEKPYISAMRSS